MSGDLSTYLTAGYYSVWGTGDAAKIKGWPFAGSGIMQVLTFGNVTQQLVMTRAGIALRALVNGVPFEWDYLSGGESESSAGSGGSGWKRVPLAVTLGQPDADAPTSGQYRVPLRWDAPIVRWRLHVANRQPKTGASRGSVDLGGVWAGARGVDGAWSGTPTQISGAVSLPSDGSEWVSEWRDEPLDGDRMLAFTYTAPAAPWSLCGGGWSVTGPIDGTATALTTVQSVPLSWWIEAETYATTPVVAVIGDSLSCGVGATTPVLDSVLSQWCRAHGALPVHWAASGDHMLGMADGSAWKWTRWDGLARPDAVLWAVGSNDLASADLATMRARFSSVLPIVRERTDGPIFLATISPRDGETGTWETTRRAYNTWLRSRPAGARAVFEFAAAVSPDDETLIPALTSDGIHLTTAGYAAQVAAIASPLTSPAPVYA
ncbi:SGNH/GDSL hydrolase family protein [Brachybacterium paraconglomeratum]|uniref:SGNH/GDSL hydrolase family protein n=1 Tax=Brachybacterium paraconglomeratum TaxID=173362 RepID=UPI0037C6BB27